ncbi:MAG TPA: nucleotidyl transferase AbiEii/AbiGii toxin family protein [Gammaproteobacteria bacterium]|nr:nucleotidyl transferase AbiEii/AbiGii toxin family protein [Gammaproteobacteria bacterium]
MNPEFLAQAACFFGGGTQLAMALGEYRESRDIDFLCSSRAGVRLLREQITSNSLGRLVRGEATLELLRDVRADRDGIRTFLTVDGIRLKLEIVFEGRIDLDGELDRGLGVPVLNPEHAVAEKLLANADRGLDESTLARDLIDLAFAAARFGRPVFAAGLSIAEQAYGSAIRRYLDQSLAAFRNRSRAAACIQSLAVSDTATLRKGLRSLRTW